MGDFWREKVPCWKIMDCPEYVYKKCPSYLDPQRPFWEVHHTQAEMLISIKKDCKCCKVYGLYNRSADYPISKLSIGDFISRS